jgi:hypothetical protein
MTITDYVVSALAGATLVGICVLAAYGQSTAVLTPILTALVAYILGKKNVEIIAGAKVLGSKLVKK